MTTSSKPTSFASLGDRFAELSVVVLTVVALAAGWLLKTGVENRSQAFTSGNITAQEPAGWLNFALAPGEVLHVADRTSSGFETTYIIEAQAVPPDALPGDVASLVTLKRGSELASYRVLGQQEVLVQGRPAVEIEYVYVESDSNLSRSVLPAVVHGVDYVFVKNGQAVVVSFRASQAAFDSDRARFNRFLVSVNY